MVLIITQTDGLPLGLYNNMECSAIELCIKISVALCALRKVLRSVHEQLLSIDCPLLYACRVLIVCEITML